MNEFFAAILNGINTVINNYGWSMVVFTVLIKLLIVPLDYKSRKSMRRMTLVQPQMQKLQKKYANDKEKLNQKMSELYRKEKINPMSGCLPMLISMPILFIMFAAMRMVANTELAKQAIDQRLVVAIPDTDVRPELNLRHSGNRCQSFTPETFGRNFKNVFRRADFGCSVTFEGKSCICF